jgi:hypothetical protein
LGSSDAEPLLQHLRAAKDLEEPVRQEALRQFELWGELVEDTHADAFLAAATAASGANVLDKARRLAAVEPSPLSIAPAASRNPPPLSSTAATSAIATHASIPPSSPWHRRAWAASRRRKRSWSRFAL